MEAQKSGLRVLKQGDVLFKEDDKAESLYIIQKGLIRLFRPKGSGFVDLNILRVGEVIGEMAYFDKKSRQRSCSASALVETEIIEVSFSVLDKLITGLNPWFKTIINTLVERLRSANEKVRSLQGNSVSPGYGGKAADYKFLQSTDVVRMLSMIYLILRAHGEKQEATKRTTLHIDRLKFYMLGLFSFPEVKMEEFIQLLCNCGFYTLEMDDTKTPNILNVENIDMIRDVLGNYNQQRKANEANKIDISDKCEALLKAIVEYIENQNIQKDEVMVDIKEVVEMAKAKKIYLNEHDLRDAAKCNLVGEVMLGEKNRSMANIKYKNLKAMLPTIRFINTIERTNRQKKSH